MFSHVTIGVNDMVKARAFYDAVFACLGHSVFYAEDDFAGYGTEDGQQTWIGHPFNEEAATFGNGTHFAYFAKDRGAVDAFYQTALEMGGSDEGAPGLRPHYGPHYYGAYVRDPDGNKLQAVCNEPA